MKSRQNRWNGGAVGREDYLEGNNLISSSQNYVRNVGCYTAPVPLDGVTFSRPVEWRTLPGMTQGDQIFAGLFAVYDHDSNFVAFTCRGAYQVNWGDGTSNTYADNTTAQKVYNKTTYSGLTSGVFEGYKNLVITITPQSGNTLTSISLLTKHTQSGLSNYVNQWLDIKIAGPSITTLLIGTDNSNGIHPGMLKEFEYVGTNLITNFGALFGYAYNLINIKSLHTANATNFYRMHFICSRLQSIPFYNTSNVTTFEEMFYQCYYLRSVHPFNTSKGTNFYRMFYYCSMLTSVPSLDTSNGTDFRATFADCRNLKTIPWMDTRKATNMNSLFANCYNLRKVPFLNTSNVTDMAGMFSSCITLETIPPIDFSKTTTLSYTFATCYNLRKLPYLNTSTALTNVNYAFTDASNIEEINFQTTANVTQWQGTFVRTRSLTKLTGIDTSKATNVSGMFTNCGLELCPVLNFDSLVNGSDLFYASSFKSFGNTYFSFPKATSLGSLFRYSAVAECPPIDAPLCLYVGYMFEGSYLVTLKGLTLPRGISLASFNASGFNNMFNNCGTLSSIPNFNLDGLSGAFTTIFASMFSGCKSLGSLNGITGIAYNLDLTGLKLSGTALNEVYQGLAIVGASGSNTRTITVTSNWGTATDDPSIAIAKGWAVTG
jgi:hypothetical protein